MLTHLWMLVFSLVCRSEGYGVGGVIGRTGGSEGAQVVGGSGAVSLEPGITLARIISRKPLRTGSGFVSDGSQHMVTAGFGFDDGLGKLLDKFRDGLQLDKFITSGIPTNVQVNPSRNGNVMFGGSIGFPISFPFPIFPNIQGGSALGLSNPVMQINSAQSEGSQNGYSACGPQCSQTNKGGYTYPSPYGTGKIDFSQLFGLQKSRENHHVYPPQGCDSACFTPNTQNSEAAIQFGPMITGNLGKVEEKYEGDDIGGPTEQQNSGKALYPPSIPTCGPSCTTNPSNARFEPNNRQFDPNFAAENVMPNSNEQSNNSEPTKCGAACGRPQEEDDPSGTQSHYQNQPLTKPGKPQGYTTNSNEMPCGVEPKNIVNEQPHTTGANVLNIPQQYLPPSNQSPCGPSCEGQQSELQSHDDLESSKSDSVSQNPSYGEGSNEPQENISSLQSPPFGVQCEDSLTNKPLQNPTASGIPLTYLSSYNKPLSGSPCEGQQNQSPTQNDGESQPGELRNSPPNQPLCSQPAQPPPQYPVQQIPSDISCDSECAEQPANKQAGLDPSLSQNCGSNCALNSSDSQLNPQDKPMNYQPDQATLPQSSCGLACLVDTTMKSSESSELYKANEQEGNKPKNRRPNRPFSKQEPTSKYPTPGVPAKRSYPERSKLDCQIQGTKDCQQFTHDNGSNIPDRSKTKPRRRCGFRRKANNLPRRRRPQNQRRINRTNPCRQAAGINVNSELQGSVMPVQCRFHRRRPLRGRINSTKGKRRCQHCGSCGNRRKPYKRRKQGLGNELLACQQQLANGLPCNQPSNQNLPLIPQKRRCNVNGASRDGQKQSAPNKNGNGNSPCGGKPRYPGRRRKPGAKKRPISKRPKDDQIERTYPTTNDCFERSGNSEGKSNSCTETFLVNNPSGYQPLNTEIPKISRPANEQYPKEKTNGFPSIEDLPISSDPKNEQFEEESFLDEPDLLPTDKPVEGKPKIDESEASSEPEQSEIPTEGSGETTEKEETTPSTNKSLEDKPTEKNEEEKPTDPKTEDAPEKTDAPVKEKPPKKDEPTPSTEKPDSYNPNEKPADTPDKTESPPAEPKDPKADEKTPSTDKPVDDKPTEKNDEEKPTDPKGEDATEKTDAPVEEKPPKEDEPTPSTEKPDSDKPADKPADTFDKTESPPAEPKDPKADEKTPSTDKVVDDKPTEKNVEEKPTDPKMEDAPEKTDAPVEEKPPKEDEPTPSTEKPDNDKPTDKPADTPDKTESPPAEPKDPKADEKTPSTDKPVDDKPTEKNGEEKPIDPKVEDAPEKTDAPVEEKPPKEHEPTPSTEKPDNDKPTDKPADTPDKTESPPAEPKDPKADEKTPSTDKVVDDKPTEKNVEEKPTDPKMEDAPEKTDAPVEEKPPKEDEPTPSTEKPDNDKPTDKPADTPDKTESPPAEPKDPKTDEKTPSTDKPVDDKPTEKNDEEKPTDPKMEDAPEKTDAPVEEKPPKEDEPTPSTEKPDNDKPTDKPADTPDKTEPPPAEPKDPKADEKTPSTDKPVDDKPTEKNDEEKPTDPKGEDATEKTDAPVEEKPPKEDEPTPSTEKPDSDKPAEKPAETPDKTEPSPTEPKDPKADKKPPSTDKPVEDKPIEKNKEGKPTDPKTEDASTNIEGKPPKEDVPTANNTDTPKPSAETGQKEIPIEKPSEETSQDADDYYDDYDNEDYYEDYSEDDYPSDDEEYEDDYESPPGTEQQEIPSDKNQASTPPNLAEEKGAPPAQPIVPSVASGVPYFRRRYVII